MASKEEGKERQKEEGSFSTKQDQEDLSQVEGKVPE
jgi:hypothetical protein